MLQLVEQLKAAVDSIPSYIERSAMMWILVPPCKHQDIEGGICDFNSWRDRGWCRMEAARAGIEFTPGTSGLVNSWRQPLLAASLTLLTLPHSGLTRGVDSRWRQFAAGKLASGEEMPIMIIKPVAIIAPCPIFTNDSDVVDLTAICS